MREFTIINLNFIFDKRFAGSHTHHAISKLSITVWILVSQRSCHPNSGKHLFPVTHLWLHEDRKTLNTLNDH